MPEITPDALSTQAPGRAAMSGGSAGEIDAQAFAIEAARLLNDRHCEDILVYDVRGLSPVTQFIVIGTGTSDRQIKSVGGDVADLGETHGFPRYGSDRDGSSTWMVVDLVEVMAHLFEPAARGHYDLEMLWGDAPQIKWRRQAGL
jgi:ribosome-associated protein